MLQDISATQWALLATAAVLVFWMVGAYNRLVALRIRIGAAWQQVHGALQRRDAVLQPLQAAIVGPLAAEQGALDALGAALERARQAATAFAVRPVALDTPAAWVQAEAELAARAARVQALLAHDRSVREQPGIAALLQAWRAAEIEVGFARRLFDLEAQAYNEAAQQAPTRWLLRLYRFGPAGLLGS
jgi:LemA protein